MTDKKTAFLIYPPTGLYDRSDRCQSYLESETGELVSPPMDLLYMASVLEEAGYKASIKDYPIEKKGWNEFKKDLEDIRPKILVISTTTATIKEDLRACDFAKSINAECLTVGKGAYVGDNSESILALNKNIDIFINNEPEFVIKDMALGEPLEKVRGISYRKGGSCYTNPPRPFQDDLDTLPLPARHLLKNNYYRMPDTDKVFTTILTGRGCPFRCIYCLAGKVGGASLRLRSPGNIVKELEECVNKFGIRNFWMRADTFTYDRKWVIEICRLITEKSIKINWMTNSRVDRINDEILSWMKKAGCSVIGFGIESGDQDMLNKMRKGITLEQSRSAVEMCKKHKIRTYLNFIVGLPWESEDSFRRTIKFAKSLKADMYNFSISYPFPGTDLYRIVKENNLLKSDEALSTYGFFEPVADTLYMKKDNVAKLKESAFRQTMLDPVFILRTISSIRSIRVLISYMREAFRLCRVIYKRDK